MKFTTPKELKNLLKEHFKKVESVDRAGRGEDTEGEYSEEDEGTGVTYENKEKDDDEDDKEVKGHAVPSDHLSDLAGPAESIKLPPLKNFFKEGKFLGLAEISPPGWEKTIKKMKKHKEIDNPFALAWYMKNKGYKPEGK